MRSSRGECMSLRGGVSEEDTCVVALLEAKSGAGETALWRLEEAFAEMAGKVAAATRTAFGLRECEVGMAGAWDVAGVFGAAEAGGVPACVWRGVRGGGRGSGRE